MLLSSEPFHTSGEEERERARVRKFRGKRAHFVLRIFYDFVYNGISVWFGMSTLRSIKQPSDDMRKFHIKLLKWHGMFSSIHTLTHQTNDENLHNATNGEERVSFKELVLSIRRRHSLSTCIPAQAPSLIPNSVSESRD